MIILGINAYHGDASACLVVDGKLVCAIEEERIRRIKHWAGLPSESVSWCLSYADINIKDVDYIAISRNPYARIHKKLAHSFFKRPTADFLKSRLSNYKKIIGIKKDLAFALGVEEKNIRAKVVAVEHHVSHLASSFFVSPFKSAAVVSIDGFGDFASTMTATGNGSHIKICRTAEFPHSLGVFYTALTQFLGFWNYGDEYKVMGLSAFGEPAYMDKMRKIVNLGGMGLFKLDTSYFMHDKAGVEMTWFNEGPFIGRIFSEKLIDLLGKPREKDEDITPHYKNIAASVQAVYEEAFFHILKHVYGDTGLENIALSGGCIQNSLANGKIYDKTPFRNVYIPPSSHDGGGSIGAAFYVWSQILKKPRTFVMDSPYWGPQFTEKYIEAVLKDKNIAHAKLEDRKLYDKAAGDIAAGKIVGWFQGRTEWGPRALGNRSILADPRRSDMKDILNAKIKKREFFRPFAPSVLEGKTSEWFEEDHPVPFMEKVYRIKEDKKHLIPAVCHIDGTGRLQSVNRSGNMRYYDLIKAFDSISGVPMLLNTSFNENEPIVNTPEDAIRCFEKAGMDVLVLENFYIAARP